jgi:hypothetical protein
MAAKMTRQSSGRWPVAHNREPTFGRSTYWLSPVNLVDSVLPNLGLPRQIGQESHCGRVQIGRPNLNTKVNSDYGIFLHISVCPIIADDMHPSNDPTLANIKLV